MGGTEGGQAAGCPSLVEVLGPCRVLLEPAAGPAPPATGPPATAPLTTTQRRVLARLALAAPHPVPAPALVEAVWGDDPPSTARAALNNQISRVRAQLGPDAITTTGEGYALGVPTDLAAVTAEVAAAEAALVEGEPGDAFATAERALARWRGVPLTDLDAAGGGVADLVEAERRRLDELRTAAENLRLAAAIDRRRPAWAIPEAERLVALSPHDEQRWASLVRALDLAGRRGDALGAYERARRVLVEDLGLEPGPALRQAEAEVLGRAPVRARTGSAAMVGRQDLVDRALDRVGAGGVLVFTGEPGAGKTTLLGALARRLRRAPVALATVRCVANPHIAVSALVDLLDDLHEALDQVPDPGTAFLAAVRRVVARGEPVVLVVDDVDLAGPTSAAALAEAARVEGVALLAATGAPDRLTFAPDEVVEVPPLGEEEVARVASALLASELDPGDPLVGRLVGLSGGNPLLVEHLLEDPDADALAGDVGVPGRVPSLSAATELRALVRRRVEGLDATARVALEVAAVCGPEAPPDLLAHLAPPAGLATATAAGLLVTRSGTGGHRLGFRHGAVQRIVYEDLPPGRRAEIHHRAATLLGEAGAPASIVAPHALAAAVDGRAASDLARRAAVEAAGHGAHTESAQWCSLAIEAADRVGPAAARERVAAMIGRGDALRRSGSATQEAALFAAADAAVELGDPGLVGDAAFALLQLGATTGSGSLHRRAVELADDALAVATDPEQRATIAAAASLAHSMTGQPDRCRALFLEAERAARSPVTRRHVLPFAYLALGHPADLAARRRATDELLDLAATAGDAVARFEGLQLSFSVGLQCADGDRTRGALEELRRLVRRVGDVGQRWALAYLEAATAHLDDELEEAERRSEAALHLFAGVSPSRAVAAHGGQLLAIRMAQGRVAELAPALEDLLAGQPAVPAWHAALALALADHDPGRARDQAGLALEEATGDFTWLATHLVGGRAVARLGDRSLAAAYRACLDPWSGQVCWQGTCAYGPVDTTLAWLCDVVGERATASRHRVRAASLAASLDAPVFAREVDADP